MGIKIVCAWCSRTIEEPKEKEFKMSHGICPICYEKHQALIDAMNPGEKLDHSTDLGGEG